MLGWKQYLVHFLDDWLDFRLAEFIALLELNNLDPSQVILPSDNVSVEIEPAEHNWKKYLDLFRYSPKVQHFLIVRLPNDQSAKSICDRAVLVKAIYSLWAHDTHFDGMIKKLGENISDKDVKIHVDGMNSWSVQIQSFGKSYSMEQKQALRSQVAFIPFRGPVNLSCPDMEMWIIVDFTTNILEEADKLILPTVDELLHPKKYTYFGRNVASNNVVKQLLCKYDLKKRSYLGPTSLDCLLTFILSNIAKVVPNMLCYEPFMGTGSIAIALTHLQAMVIGSDIDPRVLRGEMYAGKFQESNNAPQSSNSKKRNVLQNFVEYGLPVPELIRMDHHLLERHFHLPLAGAQDTEERIPIGYFDSIVTDPPYGIRAGAKKSGKKNGIGDNYSVPDHLRLDHVPVTQNYPVEEVMLDLLHTAALTLTIGGILVYLLPTTYDFTEEDLSKHPCLKLIEVCHQPLSSRHGRRAVVMTKFREYLPRFQNEFSEYKQYVLSGQDEGFGKLISKLEIALSSDAFENDSVVKRLGSLSERRRESKLRRKELREQGIVFPVAHPHPRLGKKNRKGTAVLELSVSSNDDNTVHEATDIRTE